MHKSVVLYARLSVTTEESVSIARQLESARSYCAARGWAVIGEYVDDGVSASKVRPEDRPGWRALLAADQAYDAVVVWKIDRLARKVLDFLHADETLQGRRAGIVAVEDPVDMTTPQGRAFATMLAVFGEMEAAAISSRVLAARDALIKDGRRTGGRPPFGWRNIPNPDGPGMVLAQDPDRIDVVRDLAERAIAGTSLYGLARWLTAEGVKPRPRRLQGSLPGSEVVQAPWHDASVEAILRAPALAGMTPYRGDVVRGADGLPVIDPSVAILTAGERRALLATLEAGKRPGTRQTAGAEPALLYGIARCESCKKLLYRATAASKYKQYRCQQRTCPQPVGIARGALEEFVVEQVLGKFGDKPVISVKTVMGENTARLADIEAALRETAAALTADGADMTALGERLGALKEARAAARAGAGQPPSYRASAKTLSVLWAEAADVEAQRLLLKARVESVMVRPASTRGRKLDPARIEIAWLQVDAETAAHDQRTEDLLFMRAWRSGQPTDPTPGA